MGACSLPFSVSAGRAHLCHPLTTGRARLRRTRLCHPLTTGRARLRCTRLCHPLTTGSARLRRAQCRYHTERWARASGAHVFPSRLGAHASGAHSAGTTPSAGRAPPARTVPVPHRALGARLRRAQCRYHPPRLAALFTQTLTAVDTQCRYSL
jgi:hypothetical protein